MERRVEELLVTLHSLAFTDAESIISEIRAIVLSPNIASAQMAFFSSKLLNSEVSLLQFIKNNRLDNDRLIWKTMSNALELVSDYIRERALNIGEYVIEIKEVCLQLMAPSTKSSLVKEAALRPLIKLLEVFTPAKLKQFLDPNELFSVLLDNKLKFEERTMGSTLKGAIFNMLGLLISNFEMDLQNRLPEVQRLMLVKLKEEIYKGAKTEEKSLAGILKGISNALKAFNYEKKELQEIFDFVKAFLKPLTAGRYTVAKASMKVLSENARVFETFLTEHAIDILKVLFDLNKQTSASFKYLVQETIENCLSVLSESLQVYHKPDAFEYILKVLNAQVSSKSAEVLHSTIRSIGVFSQAIAKIKGQEYLKTLLENIMQLSSGIFSNEEEEDFKTMIYRQKKLISLLVAYSDIVRSMDVIPESVLLHFSDIAVEIFNRNHTFHKKHRKRIYDGIAQLFAALYTHSEIFVPWIRVFICKAMRQLFTLPEEFLNVKVRIELASKLWIGIFGQECLTEGVQNIIADEIARFYQQLIITLDLNYSIIDEKLVASNSEDQQLFYEASEFAEFFFPKISKKITDWIMPLITSLSKKINELQIIPSLYMLTKVTLQVCSISNYCDSDPQSKTYILAFIKSIIKRMQGFQDALLSSCIEVCLAVPVAIVFYDRNNLKLFEEVILQALYLGLSHFPLAHTVISMLNSWRKSIPIKEFEELLPKILPALSPYLTIDKITQEIQGQQEVQLLRQKKKTIAFRVVKFLGSLGGAAHHLVNKKQSDIFLAWDTEVRLKLPISLNQKKIELHLDEILPRLIILTEHSNDKKTKIAACELLHSLIIFMIGKNTQVEIPFSKIYQHIFPVVYRLATDLEILARQLFEPLSKQLVRWFAKSCRYEQAETMALLDSLIESVCSPGNSGLRNLASECIGEFCRYVILYNAEPMANFKSVIRRVAALANHPQQDKRKGAMLCFKMMLTPLGSNDQLVDKFLLEFAHIVFITTRLSHFDKESEEMLNICRTTLSDLKAVMEQKIQLLMRSSEKRAHHKNIYEFLEWLWDLCKRPERICREYAQDYWKTLSMLSRLDVRKWQQTVNQPKELAYNYRERIYLEGLIDFILWSSECGISSREGDELDALITDFIHQEKNEEDLLDCLRTFGILIKYIVYFPHPSVNEDILLRFLIAPNTIGFYQHVETQEFNMIYENICLSVVDMIKHYGVSIDAMLALFEKLNLDSERTLKIALSGICKLLKTQNSLQFGLLATINEILTKKMIDNFHSESTAINRKGKIILEYFAQIEFSIDLFVEIISIPKILNLFPESIFNYICLDLNQSLGPFFLTFSNRPEQLLCMLVPLLEKCNNRIKEKSLDLKVFTSAFISNTLPAISQLLKIPSPELSQGIIKIYCIFLEFTKDLTIFGEGFKDIKENLEFYTHLVVIIRRLLSHEIPISVKREVFHLIALGWEYYDSKLYREVKESLLKVQEKYFLPSTQGQDSSKETSEFQMMATSFLQLFSRVPNVYTLELLYPLLREESSAYEKELKYVVNQFIHQELQGTYERTFETLLKLFYDDSCDSGIVDNIRWGIASRVLIPMINSADEALLEKLIIAHTLRLIGKVVESKFTEIYDSKEYLFRLREKTCILMMFERFFSRMPSNVIKESIHKSLYGTSSQGNELTKQIISFCGKYRKERPEKYELIESFANSQEYIRQFSCASYACLLTCIRKTQSQEKIYVNFLFRDQNWKILLEEKDDFGFTPQTLFSNKERPPEIQKQEQKISSVYISASLFSQDITSVRATKKKMIDIPEEAINIELEPDILNSHLVMKPLLEVIEKMDQLFNESLDMPQWMQCLHSDLSNQFNYLSIKLFIIKIIINRPHTFSRWKDLWIGPISNVMVGNNGGVGLHYFLRDVATLFLYDWDGVNIAGREREASKFLNQLVKVGADTNKLILESNLEIISGLIKKWKSPLDYKYIHGMINRQIKDEDSRTGIAWRLTGIILYGVAVDEKVKVLQDGRENYEALDESLMKCLDVTRKHIVLAAAEVLGKRISIHEPLLATFLGVITKKENKDIGLYVNILEKVTLSYPKLLDNKGICFKLSAYFIALSGITRASLLKVILNYTEYIKTCASFNNIPDLSEYLYRDREKIINDNEDSHRLALLKLILVLLDLQNNPSVRKTVSGYIPMLSSFCSASNTDIRKYLYMVMRKAYDESKTLEDPKRIRSSAREVLLKGLTDSDHSAEIMTFWNHQDRLSLDPHVRMDQCLNEMYTPECEELWLVASSHLLMKLAELGTEYQRVLFDHPLANCMFQKIDLKAEEASSLPMTPMFSPSYYHQDSVSKLSQRSSQFAVPAKPTKIRHLVEGSQASIEDKREKIRKIQLERLEQRVIEQRCKQVNIVRDYRSGELPDIQIKMSDILLPLSNLILMDSQIASHMWVWICTAVFDQLNNDFKRRVFNSLNKILELSEKYDSSVMSCIHRVTRELVKNNSEFARDVNPKHVSNSGIRSLCYQSAIMLIQECLLRYEGDQNICFALSGCEKPMINHNTRGLWLALTKIYEKMGDTNTVKGLWLQIVQETSPNLGIKIKRALDLKSSGEIKESIREFSGMIEECKEDLAHEIKNEYFESLAYLGKWEELKNKIEQTNSLKIKCFMRLNEFVDLTEVVRVLPSASLYNRYPYEMSLLNITQDDTDRAKYYLDHEFSRFVEKWQSLSPLSFSARHKLVQKLQKMYELSEFLSIYQMKNGDSTDDFSFKVEGMLNDWTKRIPSIAMDDIDTWEELLFGRILYYDKLRSSTSFQNQSLIEYPSLLCAATAEFPLKLGWLEVSEKYLREAINRRENRQETSISIISPLLRVTAKRILKESNTLEIQDITNQFDKIFQNLNIHQERSREKEKYEYLLGHLYQYLTKSLLPKKKIAGDSLFIATKNAYKHLSIGQTAESQLKFARFCDLILRNYEEDQTNMQGCLQELQAAPEVLARSIIIGALQCMKVNNQRAHDMFPRLIDLLRYPGVSQIFKSELTDLPEWMIIRWIGQILAIFDNPQCDVFSVIIFNLTIKYPQVFYYPYKTFCSIDSYDQFIKVKKGPKSITWKAIEGNMEQCKFLNDFSDALDFLTHPEHRFRCFVDEIREALKQGADKEYFDYIAEEMHRNLINVNGAGNYNKKFSSDWKEIFASQFGKNFANLSKKTLSEFNAAIEAINKKMSITVGDGREKLSVFSEWLADYGIDNYTNESIQIPGFHSGLQQPIESSNINIVSFDQTILILGSIRRPKRVGIHGSDEKEHYMLVKGGEDLRLDQRIQMIFDVMNRIFALDPECSRLSLKLKTFNIVPITKRLGILEWVSNTEPLKSIINTELSRHYNINDIRETDANKQRLSWLNSLAANASNSRVQEHVIALGADSKNIIKSFKHHESSIPWDLIRQGLLRISTTPESYIYLRKQFILSLATISVAGYIIGLGDRHLENFLLDKSDGGLLAIDFGISFGSGIGLGIPELMPFRMTRQLISVLSPEGMKGDLRHAMIHCLKALRKHKNIVLDCCQVFINEPLQEWIKPNLAKSTTKIINLPKKKMDILKKKLTGGNSAYIMLEELEDTSHATTVSLI